MIEMEQLVILIMVIVVLATALFFALYSKNTGENIGLENEIRQCCSAYKLNNCEKPEQIFCDGKDLKSLSTEFGFSETQLNNFLKFIAEVALALIFIFVVISPDGIVSNVFNYLNYIEPIILQDQLTTAINVADYSPGEFYTLIKSKGFEENITIFKTDDRYFISVEPVQKSLIRTNFARLIPSTLYLNCELIQKQFIIKEQIEKRIIVKKTVDDGCKINVTAEGVDA